MASTSEKPLSEAIRERRATPHFDGTPIPDEDLKKILQAGMEAPSGYNLQPWRFVVVRDPEQRKRLREAAMGQPKVEEASAVIVACGDTEGWKSGDLDEMLRLGNERGYSPAGNESARKSVNGLLGGGGGTSAGIEGDIRIWVNRHVMIAFTTLMWMAEVLGYDTAPMEGFFEDRVREVLGIPGRVKVVALLAIGRRAGDDKRYGGRFDLKRVVFEDRWGNGMQLRGIEERNKARPSHPPSVCKRSPERVRL
jgi:nitroreductase